MICEKCGHDNKEQSLNEYDKKQIKLLERIISLGAQGKGKDILRLCPELKELNPGWADILEKIEKGELKGKTVK